MEDRSSVHRDEWANDGSLESDVDSKKHRVSFDDGSPDDKILSIDSITIEKIVLKKANSLDIILTKSEISKKLTSDATRISTSKSRSSLSRKRSTSTNELSSFSELRRSKIIEGLKSSLTNDERSIVDAKLTSKLPIFDSRKIRGASLLGDGAIGSAKIVKNRTIGSLGRFNRIGKNSNLGKVRKIPPKVPVKPIFKSHKDVPYFGPIDENEKFHVEPTEISKQILIDENGSVNVETAIEAAFVNTRAHERLEKSHCEIERLQKNLQTKINPTTAVTYKQLLPGNHQPIVAKLSSVGSLDLNENVTKKNFDVESYESRKFDATLEIEKKRFLETDIDRPFDVDTTADTSEPVKLKHVEKVSDIENRRSGEFLKNHFDRRSSESSRVEESVRVKSPECTNVDSECTFIDGRSSIELENSIGDSTGEREIEKILEDTVDSESCVQNRIRVVDRDVDQTKRSSTIEEINFNSNADDSNESSFEQSSSPIIRPISSSEINLNSKIEKSSIVCASCPEIGTSPDTDFQNNERSNVDDFEHCSEASLAFESHSDDPDCRNENLTFDRSSDADDSSIDTTNPSSDGYASLIKEFTMEGASSKFSRDEKKKKTGFRRLLPGIFSPKDSRKEYKKEQKERKKREEKHFNQHQQNGIYSRSPDTMNLNEDITRNVKLDTSLNSAIIEERLNEIKQELFPDQGMTTSTPDHFLQNDRTIGHDARGGRSFTVNSSLSSIATDDKWLDHNIISGSPDMRKLKQHMRNENERKCSLERKLSFQESNQTRFLRNHGSSGRISAPPSERYLIRPRAVHPVDRPLPAIPQKVEFSNYQNHEEIRNHPNYFVVHGNSGVVTNYPDDSYRPVTDDRNYENHSGLYENGNHMIDKSEINRNRSIDSGFNLTPVSAQVKITRQLIVNQNQKAPLVGRTAKYSPSSSQKSGDYADSSYTPNSSQKSEFSPGSSKSGEYYLNSPRNSCRTSPDDSFNDRRDQSSSYDNRRHDINDDRQSSHSVPYPVSPKINVQCKNDRVYDESPSSPLQEIRVDRSSLISRNVVNQNNIQDAAYAGQRGSPNIPMSSNLAKLRANVEHTTDGRESPINVGDHAFGDGNKQGGSRITPPIASSRIIASPVEFRDPGSPHGEEKESSTIQSPGRVMSPSRLRMIASPLTILTPSNTSPMSTSMTSPRGVATANRSLSPSTVKPMTSPRNLAQSNDSPQNCQRRTSNQPSQLRTPVSSPNVNQGRMTPSTGFHTPMSSFNPRRAQPNDQILIASPKRDASIYETRIDRSPAKFEEGCPDSPIPMAESPCQVLTPRAVTTRRNIADCERAGRIDSSTRDVSVGKEQTHRLCDNPQSLQRSSPIVRAMSPSVNPKENQQNIKRPEPIYVRRPGVQRAISPISLQYNAARDHSPVVFQPDTLLVPVRQESCVQTRTASSNQRPVKQNVQQVQQRNSDVNPLTQEKIHVERRVQSPSGNPRIHTQRPEVIYVRRDQNLTDANAEMKKDLDAVSSNQLCGRSPQRPNESNHSQQMQQMIPRCAGQICEDPYESRRTGRIRDSPINEQLYGTRRSQQSPVTVSGRSSAVPYGSRADDNVFHENQGPSPGKLNQQLQQSQQDRQQIVSSHKINSTDPIYGQRQSSKQQEPVYVQRSSEPIYDQRTNRQLSPSKRQTMQHLEAFYWQQKALDSQRQSIDSPPSSGRIPNNVKMDSPEVREAIYWQQLKKLDEEQQRRIFEENKMEERNDAVDRSKHLDGNRSPVGNTTLHGSAPSLANRSLSLVNQKNQRQMPDNNEDIYWQNKMQPTKGQTSAGKPPMMGQKGQNQPVLVVRPQQAVRDSNEKNPNTIYVERDDINLSDSLPRSKSVSPNFVRGNERRSLSLPRKSDPLVDGTKVRVINRESKGSMNSGRKTETPPIYEDQDVDGKKRSAPPPIFKRGSLISNSSSSVDYGTMGPKRVSFSNQANSPEVGSGNWPTKHGMAPEPPTRKHRTEERTSIGSDTGDNAVFHGHEENQNNCNNVYGNLEICGSSRDASNAGVGRSMIGERGNAGHAAEYDAKPLPPPPPRGESPWTVKRSSSVKVDQNIGDPRIPRIEIQRAKVPAHPRKWLGVSESESGSEAGEVQRILHRRNEEEWNPGGKGRQSNDTGGSGRAEGEGGSNDLAGGRRGVLGGARGSGTSGSGGGGAGIRSRDEPRRHTLSGDHQPSLHHQQFNSQQLHPLHPHHLPPPHGQYGSQPSRHTTMDLEMGTKSRQRKSPLPRGYPPPSSTMLFDDDPGIMSEVETSSTGFRRGGKQRSSLPVVRTPSKTLERPLGLVFLQYRNETKRALLPNEITSIDTVKALFVRSFPKQLTMEYLDSPHVKVYIHDSNKDMFYELEDLRSHLRDIRDRSVLRLFESTDGVAGMPGPMGAPAGGAGLPPHWEDQSYFSEPEFDSEFQHQHIHKSKTAKNSTSSSSGYYMGGSSTLPRGGPLMRAYSPAASSVAAGPNSTPTQPKPLGTPGGGGVAPAKPLRSYQCGKSPLGSLGGSARFSRDSSVSLYSIPDRLHGESGYMSSPERGGGVGSSAGRYPGAPYSTGSSYEEPYYSQYSGTVTPVIDEEASDTELLEESYSLYGVKPPGRPPSGPPRSPFPPGAPALPPGQPYDVTRIRVEQMERQLANLTGLVQKALTHAPHTSPSPRDYLQVPAGRDPYTRTTGAGDEFDKHSSSSSASLPDDSYLRTDVKPPKLGKDKSVSFEKSVSFSDEPPDMNSPKQHSPQHAADTKPTKPAIKSSTLPRMSSQERDRHKPTPPPKPVALTAGQYVYRDLALTPEMYNQLRGLQKKANDLRQEVRNLRRMSQAQAHTVRETIRDTFISIRAMLVAGGEAAWAAGDTEKMRLSREEDLYKQETIRLEKDLVELESAVEELRSNVITLQTRVNMSEVENLALILSKSSKTVADLKVRFPGLQEGMKGMLSSEMEKVVREEEFLKNEPVRLENVLTRCKKLTGTLVTLKRLASVQEQRSPNAASVDAEDTPPITPTSAQHSKTTTPVPAERTVVGSASVIGGGSNAVESCAPHQQRPENALDALLDELQTFSRPSSQTSQSSMTIPQSSSNHTPSTTETARSSSGQTSHGNPRAPSMSDIGRKGSIDSSPGLAIITPGHANTLRRLHSYPSSSDTDTSPPIARLQVSDGTSGTPPQKPPVPERNAELLQLATARRVPPPPPPRTSSRSPLASPTSPQLPPRNPTGTLRRVRGPPKEGGKPPMALPANSTNEEISCLNNVLSTSNSSSCESVNSQEGVQNKKGRQEQLEQRHQELLRKQKALQEQYARLQQLQRNASGLTTVPPAPPDLLKKTGSESNLLAKMGLGLSATTSGSLTSLNAKTMVDGQTSTTIAQSQNVAMPTVQGNGPNDGRGVVVNQTTISKIYETDIL